ncbi:hypothetical protein SLG_05340 [Sphingobium sp. SYK-6]|nr:hypothetical protein SLG_05340 [Sphingobium sp. SYK-6]
MVDLKSLFNMGTASQMTERKNKCLANQMTRHTFIAIAFPGPEYRSCHVSQTPSAVRRRQNI